MVEILLQIIFRVGFFSFCFLTQQAVMLELAAADPNIVISAKDLTSPVSNLMLTTVGKTKVSEDSANGRHFAAVVGYLEAKNSEVGLVDKQAAATSAWALGLINYAKKLWDELLADKNFTGIDREQVLLSRAILELQESNYQQAQILAESVVRNTISVDIKAQLWLVIAEALRKQNALSPAESYYQKVLDQGQTIVSDEARFYLAETQLKMGIAEKAYSNFVTIDSNSAYAAKALFYLIALDLGKKDYQSVLLWINQGKESYPVEFNNPWVEYCQITALIELNKIEQAESVFKKLEKKFSSENKWVMFSEAIIQAKKVSMIFPADQLQAKEQK